MLYKECYTCKKEFGYYPYVLKNGGGKFCSKNCSNIESGRKRKLGILPNKGAFKKGIIPWNFNNYKAKENSKFRGSKEYHRWQRAIYKMFNKICLNCTSTYKIIAHHIVPVSDDLTKAFDLNNGVTLCRECHNNIHNRGNK